MSNWVIAPILLPLLAGITCLLLSASRLQLQRRCSVAASIAQIAITLLLLGKVENDGILVYALGNWPAPFGIVLVADYLALWMLITTNLLALCALLYALRGTDSSGAHFHILFQLQICGLNGAFLTGDLFNLFVFFELLLMASYALLLHGGGKLRVKAGLHFVIINLAGSALFLLAIGTLYGALGTLNMADLARKIAVAPAENVPLVRAAGLMLFGVFALKAALLPLHLWLPAAYAHTSAAVAALFAIMSKVGVYAILRTYTLMFGISAGSSANLLEYWLLPLGLGTLIIGMLGVVASTHLRQQAAYLVIASVGLLCTAFSLNNAAGISAALYYLPHSTFAAAALFLLSDLITKQRGIFGDLLHPGPKLHNGKLLGALFFITATAVVGLPPLSGFIGKLFILQAALNHAWMPWIMASVLATALLGLIALARTGSLLFYHTPLAASPKVAPLHFRADLAPLFALLLLILGMTVGANAVFNQAQITAQQLLEPQHYIHAVLR